MMQKAVDLEIVDDMVSLLVPFHQHHSLRGTTGGSEFRDKMLLVVISMEPVRERSYAIELGGICGNIACMT
jgi:hypothetical protein